MLIIRSIYRVVFKQNRAPLVLDKGQDGDDTDDHAAGYEDDDDQAGVHDVLCCVVFLPGILPDWEVVF